MLTSVAGTRALGYVKRGVDSATDPRSGRDFRDVDGFPPEADPAQMGESARGDVE